jgi:hypothetical protein
MTLTNKIKYELMQADINYLYQLDSYTADYPNGTNFCYETVSSKAATAAMRLYQAEAAYFALAALVKPKYERSKMEEMSRRIIEEYNNAETAEEVKLAETEYFSLYSIEKR